VVEWVGLVTWVLAELELGWTRGQEQGRGGVIYLLLTGCCMRRQFRVKNSRTQSASDIVVNNARLRSTNRTPSG
jgi:hypothetical protein